MRVPVVILLFLLLPGPASPRTWHVPSEAPTIQAGVDLAGYGDTVLVACGTYYETDIELVDDICLQGQSANDLCVIIDGGGTGTVLICGFEINGIEINDIWITNGYRGLSSTRQSGYILNRCFLSGHSNSGISNGDETSYIVLNDCIIFNNNGSGMASCGYAILNNCTFYNNATVNGYQLTSGGYGNVAVYNTIIAFGGNAGAVYSDPACIQISCSNIYGNTGGDWTGFIAGGLGNNGNISEDPLFCGAPAGMFSLNTLSPCAARNNPECGQVGAFDVGCGDSISVVDVPADQGGKLLASWDAFTEDFIGSPNQIIQYNICRLDTSWVVIDSIPATCTASYQDTVITEDVLMVGEPPEGSFYKVIATTANPDTSYESPVEYAYSIDDLPPPAAELLISEDIGYRILNWTFPAIPDLEEMCLYRGDETGFNPVEPLVCPGDPYYIETDLHWHCYVVQLTDIHGNIGGFSNEACGSYPSGAADGYPARTSIERCSPNPFNPRTSIVFTVDHPQHVVLAVFSMAGELIATLTDEKYGSGTYTVEWTGWDSAGLAVSSGTYLVQMKTDEKVESRKIMLVR